MSVPVPALRLRPLTLMDLLDESFRLYRANFPLLAGISVAMVIPVLVINIVAGSYNSLGFAYQQILNPLVQTAPPPPPNFLAALVSYPVALALVPFQAGTLFAASVAIILGTQVTLLSALRSVLRRYWALWVLSLLTGVAGFALLCPPLGIWLLTRISMMVPVLFTEQAAIGTAVERSWRLTEHAFWRTFLLLIASLVLGWIVQASLAGVFVTLAGVFPGLVIEVRLILIVAVASLMSQLVEPLLVLAITLLYFDLRVRKEAFDLELMAYQLALAPSSET